MIVKIAIVAFAFAVIAWVSVAVLVPLITSPIKASILLNETVTLTEEIYEKGYSLQLAKGDKIDVRVSAGGQPVDFRVMEERSSSVLVYDTDKIYHSFQLTIPADGAYVFYVSTYVGNVKVTIAITKI